MWGISEIEPLQMAMVVQQFFTPEEKRDQRTFDQAVRGLLRPLQVLETHLQTHTWLQGDDFTLADLTIVSPFINAGYAGYHVSADTWPKVAALIARVRGEPAVVTILDKEAKALGLG